MDLREGGGVGGDEPKGREKGRGVGAYEPKGREKGRVMNQRQKGVGYARGTHRSAPRRHCGGQSTKSGNKVRRRARDA